MGQWADVRRAQKARLQKISTVRMRQLTALTGSGSLPQIGTVFRILEGFEVNLGKVGVVK